MAARRDILRALGRTGEIDVSEPEHQAFHADDQSCEAEDPLDPLIGDDRQQAARSPQTRGRAPGPRGARGGAHALGRLVRPLLRRGATRAAVSIALLLGTVVCAHADGGSRSLEVRASAYNSLPQQTDGDPTLTAWGDRLVPGMKAIAVSRDLLELGLSHGVEVEIDGLPGRYVVRDKMAKRWTGKIDIYMGEDVGAARRWGVRTVTIRWQPRD